MTEAKDCPKCGLVNPPTAQRCDCGYDFLSRSMQGSYNPQAVRQAWERRRGQLWLGMCGSAVVLFIGLIRLLSSPIDGVVVLAAGVLGSLGFVVGLLRTAGPSTVGKEPAGESDSFKPTTRRHRGRRRPTPPGQAE
jgi:hypothetical protein